MSFNQVDEGIKRHYELLAELSEYICTSSDEYKSLLIRCKAYLLSSAERSNAKTDIAELFDSLERRGHLSVGNYSVLKELIADNKQVLKIIEEYQKKMVSISNESSFGDLKRRHSNDESIPSTSKLQKHDDTDKEVRKETSQQKSAVEKQTLELIYGHREDKTFVVTKAVNKGIEVLNEHGMLIYSGLSGDGKTKNALALLSHFKKSHPDWLFLKLNDVRNWSDVHCDVNSVILLDDCLGRTNTDAGIISDGEKYWPNIYACVKSGKVKVILTIRKNIFLKNLTKLEKYELFNDNHVVDLTSGDFTLDKDIKKDILSHHCKKKNIIWSDYDEDNYKSVDQLDDKTLVILSKRTVREIIETDPHIGYPQACYLFCCHKKYTKQGPKFFQKPTEHLIDEITSMINTDSKHIEKVQYCIMSYMMLNGGKIESNKFDSDTMFEDVAKSLKLAPTSREKSDAIEQLKHRYIVKTGYTQTFEFKHQSILESVAWCFYVDNAKLLLKLCSKEFIREFIRPQDYKVSDGEVVLEVKQNDYKYLVPRFTYSLQHGKGKYGGYEWWVRHPVIDDEHFVDCLMDVIQSNPSYKQIVQDCCNVSMFCDACSYGKTKLIDRLYNVVGQDKVNTEDCVYLAATGGHTDTVMWLLDHNISFGAQNVHFLLSLAPTDTLTSMINHSNITLNHVIETLDYLLNQRRDNKTADVIISRRPDIKQTVVLRLLCLYGNHKPLDIIINKKPDEITQQNMTEAFTWACVGGHIDTVEYLLNIKYTGINCKILQISQNDENVTNLHIAAYFGRFKVFMKLIDLSLCVKDITKSGLSVLQLAIQGYTCQGMDCYKVSDIIQSESSVLAQYCKQGGKRWGMGDVSDYTQIINYLLEHKDVVIEDLDITVNGCTLGHCCVVYNSPSIIELLCKIYPSILSVQNNNKHKPIDLAVLMGRSQIFKTLYTVNTEHDTNRGSLKSLLSQGKQFAGKKFWDTKPDFLSFIPDGHSDIIVGGKIEYTAIQSRIHEQRSC